MSRDNNSYKEVYNRSLDFVRFIGVEAELPTEIALSEEWASSRTTIRAVLAELKEKKIIDWSGRKKTVLRQPTNADYFAHEETRSRSDRVETQFMELILGGDLKPGAIIRESELVRDFGASTSVVREFLIRFSRFGLIEKKPNRHWVLLGFTREFAIELFYIREMFERRAFARFFEFDRRSKLHNSVLALEDEHRRIIEHIDADYLKFPQLDERFHRAFLGCLENRFIDDFFELVSVIFHYHYRWNKHDEKERNQAAAHQHLVVIEAIKASDRSAAETAFEIHLSDARTTLLNSVRWDETRGDDDRPFAPEAMHSD